MTMTKLGSLSVAVVALIGATSLLTAGTVKYEFDGWCLEYIAEQLPENVTDKTFPGAFPRFSLPWSINADLDIVSSWSSISVCFSKRNELSRPGFVEGRITCERTPVGNGLVRIEGNGLKTCRVSPSGVRYESQLSDEPNAAVWIDCSDAPKVTTCRLHDLQPNGWESDIFLPKEELVNWEHATSLARTFFQDHLSDCGVN